MRYQLLGQSGLRVSELCLGTMTFGEAWGWGANEQEAREIFQRFVDEGGNFLDTSVNYTDGQSEAFIGRFIQGMRQDLVIATKYSLTDPASTKPNSGGNSRKNMIQSLERSLARLNTNYVDLLYLHMWDYLTPVEEVMRGLDDLVRSGKVLYVAISDAPAWIMAEANTLAQLRGWSKFIGLQLPYSLLDRSVERAVLPAASHWGMTVLPWGLLEGGLLAGLDLKKTGVKPRLARDQVNLTAQQVQIIEALNKVATDLGRPVAQVAINWVRQQFQPASVIPILGVRTAQQLDENLGVLDWALPQDMMNRLDEVSRIEAGFPQDLIVGNRYLFGATYDLIDQRSPVREESGR